MRCFVAIDVPDHLRERLVEVQRGLARAASEVDVRWVHSDALHVTLHFLGEVAAPRTAELTRALTVSAAAAQTALTLQAHGLGAFPSPGRARTLWAGILVEGEALLQLTLAVREASGAPGSPPDMQAFHPHVTLGRVRSLRGLAPLATALHAAAETPFGAWSPREIVLYRSHLRPTGAGYEALAHVPLPRSNA